MEMRLPEDWHNLLHHLWSKATREPDYVKAEWMQLEGILVRCAAEIQEREERLHAPKEG
jgi:NADH:ubiquinone oxidoreductase subunit